jgi:hypothetical protein
MTNVTRGGGIGGRAFFEQKYGRPEVYGPEQFRPGTIIHATQYEEAWPSRETESNAATLVIGEAGQKVSTKSRFLIVVAQNKSCYTTVPVYTHNGKGLTDNHVKDEHVSIRDHKIPEKDFKPLTVHAPLVTQDLKEPTRIMDVAAAWLAYPVSKPYWVPVKLVGHLEDDSTKQLTDLYQRFMKVKDESPPSPSHFPPLGKRGNAEQETDSVRSVKLSDNIVLHAPVEKETDTAEKLTLPTPSQNSSLGKQGSAEPETGGVTGVKLTANAVLHPQVERRRDAVEKTTLLTPSRNSSLGKRRSAEPETASVKSVKLRDNDSAVGRGRDAVEKMTLKSVSSQSYAAALQSTAPTGRNAVKKKTSRTTTSSHAHAPHLLSELGFGRPATERAEARANASDVWRR